MQCNVKKKKKKIIKITISYPLGVFSLPPAVLLGPPPVYWHEEGGGGGRRRCLSLLRLCRGPRGLYRAVISHVHTLILYLETSKAHFEYSLYHIRCSPVQESQKSHHFGVRGRVREGIRRKGLRGDRIWIERATVEVLVLNLPSQRSLWVFYSNYNRRASSGSDNRYCVVE